MNDFLKLLIKNKITPNGIYVLQSIKDKVLPVLVNYNVEIRLLIIDKFLTEDCKMTDKALQVLEEVNSFFDTNHVEKTNNILGKDFKEKVNAYRELFPKGKIPSGKYARVSNSELEKKFLWFFKKYPDLTWEIVLKVTKDYVEQYESNNYMYMRTSSFFISKEENNRTVTSDLANLCYNYLENQEDDTENDDKFKQRIVRNS